MKRRDFADYIKIDWLSTDNMGISFEYYSDTKGVNIFEHSFVAVIDYGITVEETDEPDVLGLFTDLIYDEPKVIGYVPTDRKPFTNAERVMKYCRAYLNLHY